MEIDESANPAPVLRPFGELVPKDLFRLNGDIYMKPFGGGPCSNLKTAVPTAVSDSTLVQQVSGVLHLNPP